MEIKDEPTYWEKINEPYKVVVLNEETLDQVNSYRLSKFNIFTFISLLFFVLSTLILSLFFFTPARKWVPGFGDINENSEFVQLKAELDTMEQIINNQQIYINSMRTMLTGEAGNLSDIPSHISLKNTAQTLIVSGESVIETRRSLKLDQLSFVPPVRGSISSPFSPKDDHYGVDILSKADTPILSTMQGVVISADFNVETGHTIIIQHPHNILSVYKHNSALLKKAGQRVESGEAIAIIGNTGELTDGPHLHFELWYEGKQVDPTLYVQLES